MKLFKRLWRFLRWQDATIQPLYREDIYQRIAGNR